MPDARQGRKQRRKHLQGSTRAEQERKIVPAAGQASPPPPLPPSPPASQLPPDSPPPNKSPWYEGTLFWGASGIAAGIVLTVVAASFARDFRWLLFIACPFLWVSFWVAFKSFPAENAKKSLLGLLCTLTAYGAFWLYMRLEPSTFTAQQKKDFTAILKTAVAAPESTLLACPKADEDACTYAAEFIPLFQRAGWKIEGPQVERVELARATRSVLIAIPGPNPVHPQNPDEGVWTKLPPFDQPVKTALEFIGVHPGSTNDPLLPENKIRIYFGAAPSDRRH
jgi:hypothetical protein